MISYSLHLSNKKHALNTVKKVSTASKHNLRQFKSEEYCKDNIVVLRGSDNILEDVKKKYHEEFDEALVKYNEGKRTDRQIQDYLKYVSESGKNDVAAEIIIQLGDEEFWHDKSMDLQRKMVPILEEQVRHLEELVPDFKIVSAVVHLDEHSPHAHIIGVPIGRGYKRGMEKQAAKTKVFTQDTLKTLQDQMHKHAERDMEAHPEIFEGESLKEIEQGRNSDWSKEFYIRQKQKELQVIETKVQENEEKLEEFDAKAEETINKLVETEAQKEFMRYAFLKEPKTLLGKIVSDAWKKFRDWWDRQKRPEIEGNVRKSVLGKLANYKKQVAEESRIRPVPVKNKGMYRD